MNYKAAIHFGRYLTAFIMLMGGIMATAQTNTLQQPGALNRVQKDTSKTNTNQWRNESANITYEKLNSAKRYIPDTSLHTFHRQPFSQAWYRDLGNLGSPANSLLFTPEYRVGPTLGYHIFDIYRKDVDSLNFYNTTRPYSSFGYILGSKLEQLASIQHTQNVKPNWNFAVDYRRITSPGFYKIQRNTHDNASFTTNFKSLDRHYTLFAAMVYNKQQHDENGGVLRGSQLDSAQYSDRKTINVAYQNDGYSTTRSTVSNVQRDFTVLLQHSYLFGKTDTTYNEDSTQYNYTLKPVFSITHKSEISTEKHTFKDISPDSFLYVNLFNQGFNAPTDSVITEQKWFWVDNKVLLNGFIGKEDKQVTFSAGLGNRFDQFVAAPTKNMVRDSLPKAVFVQGYDRKSIVSNYLAGEIRKEALQAGAWEYQASTKFFFTGPYAGNFTLNATIGKELKNILGSFVGGFQQSLNSAPYAYTNYANAYTKIDYQFNKESVTLLFASLQSPRFKFSGGLRNYVVNNYIYLREQQQPDQYTIPINITQAWVGKKFRLRGFILDNEIVVQQIDKNVPINIPAVVGRHQISYEGAIFKNALKLATGIEVRYNSKYHPAGYDAILNRFFYQNTLYIENLPQASVFLNFRIKRFRAFIMGDNLQQLIFNKSTILHIATPVSNLGNIIPIYASPDFVIRFGFSWPLIN